MGESGVEMVRYADDFVLLCRSEEDAQRALDKVKCWTAPAGLTLHPDKTHIVVAVVAGIISVGPMPSSPRMGCLLLPQLMQRNVNPLVGELLTGEPCAGEPHARFGGGRDREINRSLLPLSIDSKRLKSGDALIIDSVPGTILNYSPPQPTTVPPSADLRRCTAKAGSGFQVPGSILTPLRLRSGQAVRLCSLRRAQGKQDLRHGKPSSWNLEPGT